MRHNSRKSKIQPELTHKIESKLLISSISRQTIPSAVLSHYTPQQHQQLLQKQYNLKFMTDRKLRTPSAKKTSKHTTKDHKNSTGNIKPRRLFSDDEDEYRQKYHDLHQTHLQHKEKWIGETEKYLHLKQVLMEFLNAPVKNGRELAAMLGSQKAAKQVSKLAEMCTNGKKAQETVREVMRVLHVEKADELMPTLRARVDRFRNLDESTFKILELESLNKQMVLQFDQKMRRLRLQLEDQHTRQLQKINDDLQLTKRSKTFIQQQLSLQRQESQNLLSDLNLLLECGEECHSPPKWQSTRPQLLDLYKLIRNLGQRLQDIEVDAQQNMLKLMRSNEEMLKLEQLMGLLKDDMSRQIEEEEQNNLQNVCEIDRLQKLLDEMEHENERLRVEKAELEGELARKQREVDDQRRLMATAVGLKQTTITPTKLTLAIQQHSQAISAKDIQLQLLTETISQRDQNIIQLSQQLEKQSKTIVQLRQTSQSARYEKQQYKFLLNNHRDQLTILKQQHKEQISKIIKEKQTQIVSSNRDILQSYGQLKEQHQAILMEHSQQRVAFEDNRVQLIFIKNKEAQTAATLRDKEAELYKVLEESERYRKYLREIEESFKEMVDMEEQASKKVTRLEKEHQQHLILLKVHQTKSQQLEHSNAELTQARNQLSTSLESALKDVHQLREERIKLESTNVELRLQTISKQSQINKINQQLKNVQKQSKSHKLANEKLMGELNSVTRKLVMFRLEFKHRHSDRFRICRRELGWLRQDHSQLREMLGKEVSAVRELAVQIAEVMAKQLQKLAKDAQKNKEEREDEIKIKEQEVDLLKEQKDRLRQQNSQLKNEATIKEEELSKIYVEREELIRIEEKASKAHKQQLFNLQQSHNAQLASLSTTHQQNITQLQQNINQLQSKLRQIQQSHVEHLKLLEQQQQLEVKKIDAEQQPQKQMEVVVKQPDEVNFNQLPSILSQSLSHTSQHLQQQILIKINEPAASHLEIGVNCDILNPYDKAILVHKLQSALLKIKQLASEKQILAQSITTLQEALLGEVQTFAKWMHQQCQKERKAQPEAEDDENEWKGDEVAILESCGQQSCQKQNEGNAVNHTLHLLLDNDSQIPNVPYWQKIKANFLGIRKKLTKKNMNFKLDISAIDQRQSLHSPSSFSAGQNQLFKRFGSEPDEVLDLRDFKDKDTHRSEQMPNSSLHIEVLRRENEELRRKIMGIVDEKAEMEDRLEEQQIALQQMQAKLVSIQNETSIKGLQYNYKKLLDYLLQDNALLFEQTCRVLMKMLHFQKDQIQQYEQKLNLKKKKKKSGIFNNLFKQ